MTSALVWTIVLSAAVVAGLVTVARRVLRRARTGGPDLSARIVDRAAALRDRVRAARPVNLETWPETLVGHAVRAARPVPGGRAFARGYQVRCGARLYTLATDHVGTLEQQFVHLTSRCAADDSVRPRIRFVYDESLHPEAYRLDMDFADASPLGPSSVTTTYTAPPRALPPSAGPDAVPVPSRWFLRPTGGRRTDVPEGGAVVLGSEPGCDLVICDEFVSGRHAWVTVDDGLLVLRDGAAGAGVPARPSTNGTFLREHPVSTATVAPSEAGATLRLGPYATVEIGYDDPDAATRPMYSRTDR